MTCTPSTQHWYVILLIKEGTAYKSETPTSNLPLRIISGYCADPLFSSTEQLRKAHARTPVHLHDKVCLTDSGSIVVPDERQICRDIVGEAHKPASCGHGGIRATTDRHEPFYFHILLLLLGSRG